MALASKLAFSIKLAIPNYSLLLNIYPVKLPLANLCQMFTLPRLTLATTPLTLLLSPGSSPSRPSCPCWVDACHEYDCTDTLRLQNDRQRQVRWVCASVGNGHASGYHPFTCLNTPPTLLPAIAFVVRSGGDCCTVVPQGV